MTVERDPLRILMVMHTPPDRGLGLARVNLELGAALERLGHHVEHLTASDAPEPTSSSARAASRIGNALGFRDFSRYAVPAVRRVAAKFDVIDAQQGNLPVSKSALGFEGLLVTRSAGSSHFYEGFRRWSLDRWGFPEHEPTIASEIRCRLDMRRAGRSLRAADLVAALGEDERAFLLERHLANRVAVVRNGVSSSMLKLAAETEHGSGSPVITSIGSWHLRKGRGDWPALLKEIRRRQPEASIRLLGTAVSQARVLAELGVTDQDGVDVVSSYPPDDVPALLAGSRVGVMPSYVEGFPLALIEHFASGVPVVAYNAPGVRGPVCELDPTLLVAPGDTAALAQRADDIIRMAPADYQQLSDRARAMAEEHSWDAIAGETVALYLDAIEQLTSGGSARR